MKDEDDKFHLIMIIIALIVILIKEVYEYFNL